jgi:hypothetical protein
MSIGSRSVLPPHAQYALEALSFSPLPDAVRADVNWKKLLQFCDRTQLTLPLALSKRAQLPPEVRERIDRNVVDNFGRWEGTKQVFRQLAAAFELAGLDFLVLKGFAHCPLFMTDPRFRVQYDLDLLFPRTDLSSAYEILRSVDYEPLGGFENVPLDHLPAMVKKTGWKWKGDYFDPDMPLSIELHFRLWDSGTEGFEVHGLQQFWSRRQKRQIEEIHFQSLDDADMIGYSTLHLVRHLLRGDVRLFHVYEVADLLHRTAADGHFWQTWCDRHDESLQRVSLIAFALAKRWFHCTLPVAVNEGMLRLPAETQRWLRTYGDSPVTGLFRPNKDELWLHWSLISSRRRRAMVIARRLIPERPAGPVEPVHLTKEQITWRVLWQARCRYCLFVAQRAYHHLRTLPGTAGSAIRWFSGRRKAVTSCRPLMPY